VTLLLDESQYVGASPVLLASVLHHFFGLHAAINSFTEVVIRSLQRDEEWKRWPALAGSQVCSRSSPHHTGDHADDKRQDQNSARTRRPASTTAGVEGEVVGHSVQWAFIIWLIWSIEYRTH
jgi:hypothetical protein